MHIKFAIAVVFAMMAIHTQAQVKKPNIIFILGDDVGYKSLRCDGGNLYSTPNIAKLAQQGMRFTGCHASPLCSPSRQLLLTGKYNFRNYCKWGLMDASEKTFGNMMRGAGYKTGFFGKEQLSGDGSVLNSWGFDAYCVHGIVNEPSAGSKYKNPHLYTHGAFLPDAATLNKYGPDIVSDSVLSFIENNKSNPFFIYYPVDLVHRPFSPTPDDPEFAGWVPNNPDDTAFFPSMMHYMDKKIGEVLAKLKSLGLDKNTIVFFSGDNGTPPQVADYVNDDSTVLGGKKSTTEAGTHVPLIAYWPVIAAGTVNQDLIDFTDFLPTFAGIANIPVPTNYGPLDGVSFAPRLFDKAGTPRDWIFYHYDPYPSVLVKNKVQMFKRWAQTDTYKLYDTSGNSQRLFYNISNDVNEEHPIANADLTPQEVKIKQKLLNVINKYVAEGKPVLSSGPSLSLLTDSSVVLRDTIRINGGFTITASGAVLSTSHNPKVPASGHTSTGVIWGPFSTSITGLAGGTTYYIRAYATNFADTAYSNEIKFKTLGPPVAIAATGINDTGFTANWNAYPGATSYRLDVSGSPTFTGFVPGYSNLFVESNAKTLKGFKPRTKYYYRVRAAGKSFTTANSNVIAVTTSHVGFTSADRSNLRSATENDALKVEVFPNPASDAFSINIQSDDNSNIAIVITDINGKKVYQTNGNDYNNYVIGKEFSPGVYFIKVTQGQNSKTVKLIKQK